MMGASATSSLPNRPADPTLPAEDLVLKTPVGLLDRTGHRIVAKVNAPSGTDIAAIVRRTGGGLRRVYTEIEKLKRAN